MLASGLMILIHMGGGVDLILSTLRHLRRIRRNGRPAVISDVLHILRYCSSRQCLITGARLPAPQTSHIRVCGSMTVSFRAAAFGTTASVVGPEPRMSRRPASVREIRQCRSSHVSDRCRTDPCIVRVSSFYLRG